MNGKGPLRIELFPQLRLISNLVPYPKQINDFSNQALLAKVSIPICRDISSLADVMAQIKQNRLKGVILR